MTIKRYNSASLTKFKQELIKDKDGSYQKILLEHAKNDENHDFISWLDGKIVHHGYNGITDPIEGDIDIVLPNTQLNALEFINFNPGKETIHNWLPTWEVLQISDAANSSVWAYITRKMIAEEKLRPYDLMVGPRDKGDSYKGKSKIAYALNASGEQKLEKMGECVRNFLRNLCGLYEIRGARSLYQDCPFARAWWQHHIAESIKSTDKHAVISVLIKKTLWRTLSDKITTRLTILGDENIRNGIIMFLTKENNVAYHEGDPLKDLLISVGIMTTWCALGYFPPEQVQMHVADIAKSIEKKPLGKSTDSEDKLSEEHE